MDVDSVVDAVVVVVGATGKCFILHRIDIVVEHEEGDQEFLDDFNTVGPS